MDRRDPPARDDDEDALARCIDAIGERGPSAIDEVCGGDRALADRVRTRLEALERVGLWSHADRLDGLHRIGSYRVLAPLGRGGMGSVYLALDERDQRRVAIKVANFGGSGETQRRSSARFEREIAAVAKLEHPHVVRVLDFGSSGGRPYFAMELVEGPTLDAMVRELARRALGFESLSGELAREVVAEGCAAFGGVVDAPSEAWRRPYVELMARWTLALAQALACAHRASVVHRDVKPGNVLVDASGHVKLFDLGLAHLEDEPGMTRSSELAGTPSYVAPEQIAGSGSQVDRRTDVYALGVTLFELLTLRRPFEGRTTAALLRQIQGKQPPLLRSINPLVPRDLETICLTALEKSPEHRYQSMEELAADLERFLAFHPIQAKPVSWPRRVARFARRNPAVASAIGLAASIAVGLPIGLLIVNRAIREEQRRTETAAESARREARVKSQVTSYLVDQFRLTEAERANGPDVGARELLDRGATRLESEFQDDPDVRTALLAATGTVYKNLGAFERAIPLLDRALASGQSDADVASDELAGLLVELAESHLGAGNAQAAEQLAERALEPETAATSTRLRAWCALGAASRSLGDVARAAHAFERAATLLDAARDVDDERRASSLEQIADFERTRGALEPARAALERALSLRREAWSPDLPALASTWSRLAALHEARGDVEAAERARRQARALASVADERPAPPLPFTLDGHGRREYDQSFQAGITAVQARELGQAQLAFARCLELQPWRSVAAYNLACAYALAGDVENGLTWLERSASAGFGSSAARVATARTDVDLAALRGDPRFERALARMRARLERVERFTRDAELHVPATLDARRGAALLVVLHDERSTKRAIVDGRWRALADRLGVVLLAPSAPFPSGEEPELGMRWFDDPDELVRRPVTTEQPIHAAIRELMAQREIDRERVWIAGEGVGAMVAFDVATRAPGLFRGALLVDGPIHPATSIERARQAASLGLRVAWIAREAASAGGEPMGATAEALGRWLEAASLSSSGRVVVAEDALLDAQLLDTLGDWNERERDPR